MDLKKLYRIFVNRQVCMFISGNFSCVNFTLGFDRQFGYYLIQVYVPSILIVMLSWVSFWLDPSAVPARISLGILTLLAMTNQMSATSSDAMPRVSLVHYGDVIMGAIASQITSLTIVYSTVYSDADQRKHQSSASLAFVRGIHRDRWILRTNGQ